MHELDRIEQALATKPLNRDLFERCAQDLLSEVYPGLSPVPGGTDWGRDADIHTGIGLPMRVLITSSRTLDGVRQNMLDGLTSMEKHNVPFDRIVLANPRQISQLERERLNESAKKKGAIIDAFHERGFFASKLRRDSQWRARLLGLSADPITLSRVPSDLAESPWAELPLLGRDRELQVVSTAEGDVVVVGRPGVGKTRLLAAISGAYFVDHDAAMGRLADDIRSLQPTILVIDDAGRATQLIKQLIRFRQVEPDVGTYRLIVVCWPDENVNVGLRTAKTVELDLLERGILDQLLISMGITGRLARSEILDQAEGRPGWAVALGDNLLRANDPGSLLTGKALYGQVQWYLQRATVPPEATDLLATVACIGGVAETELGELASQLGMSRPQVVQLLTATAKSGLVDVQPQYGTRHYSVRPPMLADVLVAERAFAAEVPGVELRRLEQWPAKLPAVAESVIDSALLGAPGARAEAERFYQEVARGNVQLSEKFARIDRAAGQLVAQDARTNFEAWKDAGSAELWPIEPVINLGFLVARWYLLEEAVELLLDAALIDQRPTNQYPGHPLRKLTDLVHQFHPELPPPREQRTLVARVAERWIGRDPSDDRWAVYGQTVDNLLSLNLNSALTAPGDPRTFQWIQTVVDDNEVRRIHEEMWPPIRRRLEAAPPQVIKTVVEAVEDWLRVGKGYDLPLGRSRPEASIAAARELGESMLRQLVSLTANHLGLSIHLKRVGERYGVPLEVPVSNENAVFLADIDGRDDWEAAIQELDEDISRITRGWADQDPSEVIRRLVSLETELELANIQWPDRIWMACKALATEVTNPLAWADTALEHGLFPKASPFLERAISDGVELGEEQLSRYLSARASRWATISAILTAENAQADFQRLLGRLTAEDYKIIEDLHFKHQLTVNRTRDLLTKPSPAVRGAAAAAMFAKRHGEGEWSPGELEAEWLEAIDLLEPKTTRGLRDYEVTELTQFLATHYPDRLTHLVRSRLEAGLTAGNIYDVLPHSMREVLHQLPAKYKDELYVRFREEPLARHLLSEHLVGQDVPWLQHALDDGILTTDEALQTYNSMGPHPSIEQLSRLLLPRGVDPLNIAFLARLGSWMGEESDRYAELIEQFQALAASNEEPVASVGRAGVEMYTLLRDEALDKERRSRIRGEL